jgi:membrane fusion protein (multidrug efflux system)
MATLASSSDVLARDSAPEIRRSVSSVSPAAPPPPAPPVSAAAVEGAASPAATKRSRAKTLLPILILAAGAVGTVVYAQGRGKESTDDAQLEGHVASVASRVTGQVARVLVQDNQLVHEGDVLVELDDADYLVRLDAARADLASAKAALLSAETQLALTEKTIDATIRQAKGGVTQASAMVRSSRASIDQAKADLVAAQSRRDLAQIELSRVQTLHDQGAIAQAELDSKRALLDQADASLAQARARIATADASVSGSIGGVEAASGKMVQAQTGPEQIASARAAVEVAKARVAQSEAAVHQAELNESYTKVKAQLTGLVSRRTVEAGQLVSPERPLLAIVPNGDVWVVANFKEDQLADMRPGQAARITIDTYGGKKLAGHVDSIAGASGARFSLLPPDNASGNFVKVVQRIPVLIRLDAPPDVPLRPGMSANATVITHS